MVALISLLAFLFVTLASMAVFRMLRPEAELTAKRLEKIAGGQLTYHDLELQQSLLTRTMGPLLRQLLSFLQRRMPKATLNRVREKLLMAGRPWGLQAVQFIAVKLLLAVGTAAVALVSQLPGGQKFLLGLVGGVIGYLLPDAMLNSRVQKRQKEIQKALPDVLDLLTVSVEAGLGFDSAVAKVVDKAEGPLADEFARVLQEIRVGKPRQVALRDLSTRVGLEDLSAFVAALVQADQLGVSIGKVLRIQSAEMRRKRRQRAEEAAMKAPVKMLIPMVVFIFPTIFVILLGPAVIRILETFARR